MGVQEKHLYFLSELSDYKMDRNYPNVKGWKVKDQALRTIGTVQNLLVNKTMKRVVYLDVEVDSSIIDAKHDPYGPQMNPKLKEFVNAKGENHLIIPIGLVDINNSEKYIFTDTIDHKTFASTKRIRENTEIDRNYETVVLDSYGRHYSAEDSTVNQEEFNGRSAEPKDAELLKDRNDKNLFYTRREFDDSKMNNH